MRIAALSPSRCLGTAPSRGVPSFAVRTSPRTAHVARLLSLAVLAALATPAIAQQQFADLYKREALPPSAAGRVMVVGDLDGDGDPDVVLGSSGQARLLRNDGPAGFVDVTASRLPAGADQATAMVLGDVDGDGDLDLVVGRTDNAYLGGLQSRLYRNDGTGTFTDVTSGRLAAAATSALVLGDVDADGDLDLVVGSVGTFSHGWFGQWYGYPVQSQLFLNDGTGTFTDATAGRMPVNLDSTSALALGDVDGDGDLDLVVGAAPMSDITGVLTTGQDRLYRNDGTGTFTDVTATTMPTVQDYTSSLALGDVDGDGDLDLVLGGAGQNRLCRNDGLGTFIEVTAAQMPVLVEFTRSLTLGDVDGDGDLDLLVGNAGQDGLCVNDGSGTFTSGTAAHLPNLAESTSALALTDVDLDGDLDLLVANTGQSRFCRNDGTGTFTDTTAPRMPLTGDDARTAVLGDLDGDGDLDAVVGSRLFANDGLGTFVDASATHGSSILEGRASVLVDVDGDGDLDLVVGRFGQNQLCTNDGTGHFSDVTATQLPAQVDITAALASGDVDGDGDLDLVVGNSRDATHSGQNLLYRNDGFGTFTDVTATTLPILSDDTTSVVLGDVDGDGDLDLVVGNLVAQSRLLRNDGTGTFTEVTATQFPVGNHAVTSLALGDVDGDGDLDLVLGCSGNPYVRQQNRLYRNNGAGTFTDATATQLPPRIDFTTAVALADMDGDGDLDLVTGNMACPFPMHGGSYAGCDGMQNRLYVNDGRGTFQEVTASRMPDVLDTTRALAVGDVDGDGDLDLMVGNEGIPSRVYLNLLRQLEAPHELHVGRSYELSVFARSGPSRLVDVALPYFSMASARIPLPPFGTVGLDPNSMVALPPFLVPQPAGVGSVQVQVPAVPALAGIRVYVQALLIQYPVQERLTNVTSDLILR